jgi:hypothetical protein
MSTNCSTSLEYLFEKQYNNRYGEGACRKFREEHYGEYISYFYIWILAEGYVIPNPDQD